MAKLNWNIVHECDDENGNPAQWASEINHPKYGKNCWINDMGDYFGVEVDYGGFIEAVVECRHTDEDDYMRVVSCTPMCFI